MELTYLLGIDIVGMPGIHYQWVTDYAAARQRLCNHLVFASLELHLSIDILLP